MSLVRGLYLFIHIPCYQMCVDQLININNFYLCGVDIATYMVGLWKSYVVSSFDIEMNKKTTEAFLSFFAVLL